MTPSNKAVRKASRERLLRDFARAAQTVNRISTACHYTPNDPATRLRVFKWTEYVLRNETSRTRYACLMTAFGR